MPLYTFKCKECEEIRVFKRSIEDRDKPLTRKLDDHVHEFERQIDKPGGISCTYGPMNTR